MNINRYNYEEYFLLYVDDELNAVERQSVEDFVEQNPDLEEELSMLKQSLLKPDASVVMEDKTILFKSESSPLITLENYETFFLLYVDEELNAEERRAVESFVSENPPLQQEFQLLMQTKVEADEHVVFPDKSLLYKTPSTKKAAIISIYRVAAIAAILLLAVTIFWLRPGADNSTSPGVAKRETSKGSVNQTAAIPVNKVKNEEVALQKDVMKKEQNTEIIQQTKTETVAKKNAVEAKDNSQVKEIPDVAQTDVPDVAVRPSVVSSTATLALNVQGSDNVAKKTLIVDQPVDQTKTETAMLTGVEDPEGGASSDQNKSKLRGFFRQVKRVVEKTTHLPGEENKKLLIGNIEIAIK